MCSLCRLPVAKNHNFGQILKFRGLLYRLPFSNEGQIWCATAEAMSTLTGQISSECVHCVGFRWPKTTILSKFWQFGGSCTDPLSPMRAKFGVLEQTQGLHLQTEISSECVLFIVSASGGQKPQFWANYDIFGSSCADPLLPMTVC